MVGAYALITHIPEFIMILEISLIPIILQFVFNYLGIRPNLVNKKIMIGNYVIEVGYPSQDADLKNHLKNR